MAATLHVAAKILGSTPHQAVRSSHVCWSLKRAIGSEHTGAWRPCSFTTATGVGVKDGQHVVQVKTTPEGQNLTLLPLLHGRLEGAGSSTEAAETIRQTVPRHVFVELCSKRYGEVLAAVLLGLPLRQPPRIDVLGNIHGGILAHEFVPIVRAARDIGAAVVPVDRQRATTRNRVAQRLWHPKFIQGLLRYGVHSLQRRALARLPQDAEALRHKLDEYCPAAHDVLVNERCRFMAHQVRTIADPSTSANVVCSALHCTNLAAVLRSAPSPDSANAMARFAHRGVPVWPLFLTAYVIVPAALASYLISWTQVSLVALNGDASDTQ